MRELLPAGCDQLQLGRKPDRLRLGGHGDRHLHRPRAGQRARPEPRHRRQHHLRDLSAHLDRCGALDVQRLPVGLHPGAVDRTWTRPRRSPRSCSSPKATSSSCTRPRATCCRCCSSINENPIYQDNEIIQKYPAEVDLMAAAAAGGFNLGYEVAAHPSNDKAGEIVALERHRGHGAARRPERRECGRRPRRDAPRPSKRSWQG